VGNLVPHVKERTPIEDVRDDGVHRRIFGLKAVGGIGHCTVWSVIICAYHQTFSG
jgi:hypothetical protein